MITNNNLTDILNFENNPQSKISKLMNNTLTKNEQLIAVPYYESVFKTKYPDLDPETLDDELLFDMIQNIALEYREKCENDFKSKYPDLKTDNISKDVFHDMVFNDMMKDTNPKNQKDNLPINMVANNKINNTNNTNNKILSRMQKIFSGKECDMMVQYVEQRFKMMYPDLNPNTLDDSLLNDIIYNLIMDGKSYMETIEKNMHDELNNIGKNNQNSSSNSSLNLNSSSKEIIKESILMADEIIPEMSIPSNLIYLNGKINQKNVKVMVDTGASACVMYKSVVDKCELNYLIDTTCTTMIQGAHGVKPSVGMIWFMEIELDIGNEQFVSIPIQVQVIDDSETMEANKVMDKYYKQIENLYGEKIVSSKSDNREDVIFGMTFLKSYGANIDFSTMTLTLNKNLKIKFK